MLLQGQVGVQQNSDSAIQPIRLGKQGDLSFSELHGRFYEQAYRNNLFCFGMANTALAAANATATGLTSTAQPIVGVWNPPGSGINVVILQAGVYITLLGNSAVNPAGFVWVSAVGQSAISTGSSPVSRSSLLSFGSKVRAYAGGTALTGLSGSLTNTAIPLDSPSFTAAGLATAQSLFAPQGTVNIDGGFIVPPGGVLGIMNTTSTTTCNVASYLLWEEVPA